MTFFRENMTNFDQFQKMLGNVSVDLATAHLDLAMFKGDDGSYSIRFSRITFSNKDASKSLDKELDYGEIIFIKKSYKLDEILSLIKEFLSGGEINFGKYKIAKMDNFSLNVMDIESNRPYGYLLNEWPCMYITGYINGNALPNKQGILGKPGLPYFPDIDTAIVHLFNLNTGGSYHPIQRTIEMVIPKYSARITNITIDDKEVAMNAEASSLQKGKVVAKFYCAYTNGQADYNVEDLKMDDQIKIPIKKDILFMNLAILSSENNQILDYRDFNYAFFNDYNGTVKIKGEDSTISSVIGKGEEQRVEFKVGLHDLDDFLETVVAYANSNEGIIFIGVDKHGNIVGLEKSYEDTKLKIENWIGDFCTPKPVYTVESIKISGKELAVINVKEGDASAKPYGFKGNKFFIRSGSTDRGPDRTEFDKFYGNRNRSGASSLIY